MSHQSWFRWHVGYVFWGAVLFLIAGTALYPTGVQYVEDALYAINPSAERALQYAERHFDAKRSRLYDIERTEYFLREAVALDPGLPYIYHELARVAFLRGNFNRALALINTHISLHGEVTPNSYYVRGLIEGYMGKYEAAATDYETYLEFDSDNWAAINDYAWVLLKANRPEEAAKATARGVEIFPDNPWLLNSLAIALYETGELDAALAAAQKAQLNVTKVTEAEWLVAYPGNDPKIAGAGITALRKSIEDNMHSIERALGAAEVQ